MSERPRTMTAERRPEIKPYNPYIYHCSHCSREIPLETQEELFAATRVNGVCEYCYSAQDSSEQTIREQCAKEADKIAQCYLDLNLGYSCTSAMVAKEIAAAIRSGK